MQSIVLKDLLIDTRRVETAINQQCTMFPKNVGFNNGLRILQPDYVEGLAVGDFEPFPVEECIEGVFLHDQENPITLAHIAGEWKGAGQNLEHARIQASHDGASLVYSRNQALKYLGEKESSSNAEVITFITDGCVLKFYAHYASRKKDGTDEYHQFHIQSHVLDSYAGFEEGRKWLRNAQEHAMEQSRLLRDRLKEKWEKSNTNCEPAGQLHESRPPTPPTEPPYLPGDSNVKRRGRGRKASLPKRSGRISKRGGVKPPVRRSSRLKAMR